MKSKVLIVDDNRLAREYVRCVAASAAFETVLVEESGHFYDAYRDTHPEVITLDMVMPEPDGLDIIRWLAAQKSTAHVIVISGCDASYGKAAKVLGEALGLPHIVTLQKPVAIRTLLQALNSAHAANCA